MNLIKKLYNVGDDTFPNLYEITFAKIPPTLKTLTTLSNKLKFRIQTFTIPQIELSTYEVKYLAQKIERIKPSQNNDKKFSFNIRIDKNYEVYKAIIEWRNLIIDFYKDSSTSDIKDDLRLDIGLKPITGEFPQNKPVEALVKWDLKGCIITSIQEIEFNHETGDPLVLTVNCLYLDMKENY